MTSGDQPWTVLRLLDWTRGYFEREGVDSPRLAAEVLLAHVLGCQRIELYTRFQQVPSEPQRGAFRELVRRAADQEPVAYLVGHKEFYSLRLTVTPDVLIPRAESEALVSEALGHLRLLDRQGWMWDACTGSGNVAVATAANLESLGVLATDLSPSAVEVAGGNAQAHNVADRVTVRVADMLSLPDDWTGPARFDVITANPPYVAGDDEVAPCVRFEPELALYAGDGGLDAIRRLVDQSPGHLVAGGKLIFEFGYGQGDEVYSLLNDSEAFTEVELMLDQQKIERVAVAERVVD
jgi:release factor glutamine methyltransferase